MDTTKYKTNIKCASCIAKVTPFLDKAIGAGNWEVDISNPSKVLTVSEPSSAKEINEVLRNVGYHVERI
jgi:copper chaperone CopZ